MKISSVQFTKISSVQFTKISTMHFALKLVLYISRFLSIYQLFVKRNYFLFVNKYLNFSPFNVQSRRDVHLYSLLQQRSQCLNHITKCHLDLST